MRDEFSGEAADFKIVDGIVHCMWPTRCDLCIPLRVFRINLGRANKAVAEHDARKAEIVPIRAKRRGKGHAAA